VVGLESEWGHILLLEDVGQSLYHGPQLPLDFYLGAMEVQKAGIRGGSSGVEAIVAESLHRQVEHLAVDSAIATLSFSLDLYSMKELVMYVRHLLHPHVPQLD